jgi:Spy/CpxP family protein refolding chaperone
MTAQQVEEYFDAAVLFQAQAELRLSDDEFLTFGARLRRLQTLRRTLQRQRLQAVRGLNELLGAADASDDAVAAKVAALDALDADAARQLHDALAGIDEVLTVRQRARFRVFEEAMERRKLDLLARARAQARRQAAPGAQAP